MTFPKRFSPVVVLSVCLSFVGLIMGCAALAPIKEISQGKAKVAKDQIQTGLEQQQWRTAEEVAKLKSELAKLQAEVNRLREKNAQLKERFEQESYARASRFQTIISLKNGSIIFGEIIGESEDELKIETKIGILPIRRDWIQEIVYSEKKPVKEETETKPTEEVKEKPKPRPKLPTHAKCVLLDELQEEKERVKGATVYLGKIKNVGGRRADFVRVIFTIKDIFGRVIRSDAAFVSGSRHTFKSGISSDASLEPQGVGSFRCLVPIPARFIASYSCEVLWEEYD